MLQTIKRFFGSNGSREKRAAAGYTGLVMNERAAILAGTSAAAASTAAVQACVSLWEHGLALASVDGTRALPSRTLALIARSLAIRGEFVALIDGDGLLVASDWDLSTVDGVPRAYRLTIPDIGGGRTVTALAPEVAHVVIGASPYAPWAGTSPLRRAQLSADLLAAVEGSVKDVFADAALGSHLVSYPETSEADLNEMARAFRGVRGRVVLRESTNVAAAGGAAPGQDWQPSSLSPELRDSMAREIAEDARRQICAAYGVLPMMFDQDAAGPAVREGQRHLAQWTLQPLAQLVADEMAAKLGQSVTIDVMAPLQAYDAGGRARAVQGIVQALAQAQEAGVGEDALAAAFGQVMWDRPGA